PSRPPAAPSRSAVGFDHGEIQQRWIARHDSVPGRRTATVPVRTGTEYSESRSSRTCRLYRRDRASFVENTGGLLAATRDREYILARGNQVVMLRALVRSCVVHLGAGFPGSAR